jgi:hypothetical protein
LLAYPDVSRLSRIRRPIGLLLALAGSSCLWPQPVNEEPPPPPPTDVAPTITSVSPPIGPLLMDLMSVPGRCVIKVYNVQAETPIGRQLNIRFYFNYLNGPANPTPVRGFDLVGALSPLPATQSIGTPDSPQVFDLQQYQSQLLRGLPNTLWVWVSDGFAGPDKPDPLPGFYSTSFSWTFDLTQCPGIN